MSESRLRDWENKGESGTRFPPSEYDCPKCGKKVLEDSWPPNIGTLNLVNFGNGSITVQSGTEKCVCLDCRISFLVYYKHRTGGSPQEGKIDEHKIEVFDVTPLVEKDGFLLTPHDVWREEYREEHGEYPNEVYG